MKMIVICIHQYLPEISRKVSKNVDALNSDHSKMLKLD